MNNLLINLKIKLRILRNRFLEKRQYNKWLRNGKPVPPPHRVKQNIIKKLQDKYKTNTLIETGTYLGDMVFAQRKNFEKIYSIEIQPFLFKAAQKRFKKYKNIKILHGDSGRVLHEIMPNIPETALIWLDGHYSGGITGKSKLNCPIFDELDAIVKNNKNHLILIDDANCFNGTNDYPTYEALFVFFEKFNYKTHIKDNVIIAEKKINVL